MTGRIEEVVGVGGRGEGERRMAIGAAREGRGCLSSSSSYSSRRTQTEVAKIKQNMHERYTDLLHVCLIDKINMQQHLFWILVFFASVYTVYVHVAVRPTVKRGIRGVASCRGQVAGFSLGLPSIWKKPLYLHAPHAQVQGY